MEKKAIQPPRFSPANWGGLTPRQWQPKCLNAITNRLLTTEPAGIVRAIMGSGKSIVIAELAATIQMPWESPVVITTSSILLVKQIRKTVASRVKGKKTVGCFYTESKQTGTDIIIACTPSVPELAKRLASIGRGCGLWIADEVHRSECDTIKNAHEAFNPLKAIGFTATPFRASTKQNITLFHELLYDYGPSEALKDGVVVSWKIQPWNGPETPVDDVCVIMIRRHIERGEGVGIVNASTIVDAEAFTARLNSEGIKSNFVHSKLRKDKIDQRLGDLKNGKITCIVHVSLLCEGADYPWLRWMCLRRDVSSRVRFLQEIGRCLRAFEGKQEAIFDDPNDLFGLHRITYEAALGDSETTEDKAEEIAELEVDEMIPAMQAALEDDPAVALHSFEIELRRLIVACDAAGMCPERPITKRINRTKEPTRLQIGMIKTFITAAREWIPSRWMPFFTLVSANLEKITFGAAADMACILASIATGEKFPPICTEGLITAVPGGDGAGVYVETPDSRVQDSLSIHKKWKQMEFEFERVK